MNVTELVRLLNGKYRNYKIILPCLLDKQIDFTAEKVIPFVSNSMWTGYEWDISEHRIKRELTVIMIHHKPGFKTIVLDGNGKQPGK